MTAMRPLATPGAMRPIPESSGARLVSNAARAISMSSQANIPITISVREMRAARREVLHAPIEYIAEKIAILLNSTSGTWL